MSDLEDLWYNEFVSDNGHCGLCGNCGVIDTRGSVETPAGYPCGIVAFCICPNGRALKKSGREPLEVLVTMLRQRRESVMEAASK